MGIDDEEESLLDDIFGNKGKLHYEAFLDVMIHKTGGKWLFSAAEIRKRVFKQAEISIRHISR